MPLPAALSSAQVQAKVQQYEAFANDILKRDLQSVTEQRARYQMELEELDELGRSIEQLQQVGLSGVALHGRRCGGRLPRPRPLQHSHLPAARAAHCCWI